MTTPHELRRLFNMNPVEQTTDFQKAIDAHIAGAAQVRVNTEAALARVAEQKGLTPEARRAAAARVYQPACESIQAALDKHIAMVNDHRQQLVRKAFGSGSSADPTTAMARRQARQQAAAVTDQRQAADLIRDAEFSGDSELARAVAAVAFERGWDECIDAWNEDGRHDAAVRGLREFRNLPDTNDAMWRISTASSYTMPDAGPDLTGLRPHQISSAARDDLGGDAA